jgi:hypothetical protein
MNFFPRVLHADCAEAVILLPDSGVELTFRCQCRSHAIPSTLVEVSRMKHVATIRGMPLIEASRLQAAKQRAADAITWKRQDAASREQERFQNPFQLNLGLR